MRIYFIFALPLSIKKFYYKVRYEFFAKVRQLTLLQSAMDPNCDSFFLCFITKCDRVYHIATRITKRDNYYRLQQFARSSTIPPPSLPSLEFKGMSWLHVQSTEVLLIQVCMRIYGLDHLSELRNYSLVLRSQPTSKDKKGKSPMNTLKLILISKSILFKTKWTHLSPAGWCRFLKGIRFLVKLFNKGAIVLCIKRSTTT